MANLTIATIDSRFDEEFDHLARRILRNLQTRGLYKPNLMYRGVNASDKKIKRIARYGTDRKQSVKRAIPNEIYRYSGLVNTEEERESLIRSLNPNLIWAFQKEDLERCIEDHALVGNKKPVVLVYRPEFLVYSYEDVWEGIGVPELIKRFGRKALADAEFPLYRFREGTKPIDAAVIAYVIRVVPN